MSGVSYSRFIAEYNSIQSCYSSTQSFTGKDISWFKFLPRRFFFSCQILWIRFLNCWSSFWELKRWSRFSKVLLENWDRTVTSAWCWELFLNAPGSKHLKGKWGLNNSINIGTLRSWPYTSSLVFERFPLHLGSTVFHTCRICVVGSTVHYEERAYSDDWGAYKGSQETFSRYWSSFSVWNTRGNIFNLSFPCFSSSNMTQPLHSALKWEL